MVQEKTKGLQTKGASSRHAAKAAAKTKKGRRHIAPKKAMLVERAVMKRSLTAKINKSIEQSMVSAASSGKLTIMKNATDEGSSSKPVGKGRKP